MPTIPPSHPTTTQSSKEMPTIPPNHPTTTQSSKEMDVLVSAFQVKGFQPGEVIIQQGAEGELFYIVELGLCEITIDGFGKVTHDFNIILNLSCLPPTILWLGDGD